MPNDPSWPSPWTTNHKPTAPKILCRPGQRVPPRVTNTQLLGERIRISGRRRWRALTPLPPGSLIARRGVNQAFHAEVPSLAALGQAAAQAVN